MWHVPVFDRFFFLGFMHKYQIFDARVFGKTLSGEFIGGKEPSFPRQPVPQSRNLTYDC